MFVSPAIMFCRGHAHPDRKRSTKLERTVQHAVLVFGHGRECLLRPDEHSVSQSGEAGGLCPRRPCAVRAGLSVLVAALLWTISPVSGKTCLAHLVGTASVLARLRLERDVVAAGLLHAADTHGDFGDGRRGMSDAKRSTLRAAVGERVEGYIARYTTLDWSAQSVPGMPATLDTLDHTDRQVIARTSGQRA